MNGPKIDPSALKRALTSLHWPSTIRMTIPRQPQCMKCGGERLTLKYERLPYDGLDPTETMHVTCDRCTFSWCEQPLAEGEDLITESRPPSRGDV